VLSQLIGTEAESRPLAALLPLLPEDAAAALLRRRERGLEADDVEFVALMHLADAGIEHRLLFPVAPPRPG
jgi:hypothetical protein